MIYLDNAATTQPYAQALTTFYNVSRENWMNPSSSLYSSAAKIELNTARQKIAEIVGVDPKSILFTSGSTEAANWVLSGAWSHIITSELEHPCVYNAAIHSSAEIHIVENDTTGKINLVNLADILEWCSSAGGNILVAIMGANNEIGTIQPIHEIGDLVHCYRSARYFCDTTQLWPHKKIDPTGMDFACMSAHKFGGLKGVGFLYAKDPSSLSPLLYGGHQEFGLRAGTENVAGVVAMAEALRITELYKGDCSVEIRKQILSHREYTFNGAADGVESIVSMTMPDSDAQKMVAALGLEGIYISAGSACSTGSPEPSRILTAIGLSPEEANRTLRISYGLKTRSSDIEKLFEKIKYYRELL